MTLIRYLGYAGFFVFTVLVGLYLTFPWDVIKERALAQASAGTFNVTADSLSPGGIASFTLTNVNVVHKKYPDVPIVIDEVDASAHILPLLAGNKGGAVNLEVARGTIEADVSDSKEKLEIEAKATDVQLDFLPIIAKAIDFPLSGQFGLEIDLDVDKKKADNTKGSVALETKGLVIEKGAKLGMFPLPMDVALGDLKINVPVEKGKAQFKKIKLPGTDVELMLDGHANINFPFERSSLNLTIGLKPTQKFLNANKMIGPLLNNFSQYKSPDGYYKVAAKGSVKRPSFRPIRGRRR